MLFPDWPLARYMDTVIMDIGLIVKPIGSVYATLPFGIVTESAPLKVRPLRGEAWIPLTPACPPFGRPTEAAVMVRSLPPNVFDI
jgi:hypothetical protein